MKHDVPEGKKKGKGEAMDLTSLKGMVRVRAILRKYGVSPHVADLVTEALDHMFEKAVSDLKAEIRWGGHNYCAPDYDFRSLGKVRLASVG